MSYSYLKVKGRYCSTAAEATAWDTCIPNHSAWDTVQPPLQTQFPAGVPPAQLQKAGQGLEPLSSTTDTQMECQAPGCSLAHPSYCGSKLSEKRSLSLSLSPFLCLSTLQINKNEYINTAKNGIYKIQGQWPSVLDFWEQVYLNPAQPIMSCPGGRGDVDCNRLLPSYPFGTWVKTAYGKDPIYAMNEAPEEIDGSS